MSGLKAAATRDEGYRRAGGEEPDLGLFSSGGPFESFPGPVLVVGRNAVVLGSNDSAEAIARLVRTGGTPELREAVNAALEGRAAQINPLLLDRQDDNGEVGRAYDLMVLPWADAPAALLLGRDITLERSLRAALVESRQRYKDVLDAASDFVWETDAEGRFTFVSEAGALDHAVPDLIGRPVSDFLAEDQAWTETPFASSRPVEQSDVWFRTRSGRNLCMSVLSLPLHDPAGNWCGCRGRAADVTMERSAGVERAMTSNRDHLVAHVLKVVRGELEPDRMAEVAAQELMRALPAAGVVLYRRVQDGSFQLFTEAGRPIARSRIQPLLEELGPERAESWDDGHLLVQPTLFRGACNGALCVHDSGAKGAWRDEDLGVVEEFAEQLALVHAQCNREEEMERLSSTDSLTGLLNRGTFLDSLARRIARAALSETEVALLYIDVDNLKRFNDDCGHLCGDAALRQVAGIMRRHMRDQDLAGRIGGDEFAMLVEGIGAATARKKAETLVAASAQIDGLCTGEIESLGLSIGVAVFDPARPEDVNAFLARADRAMYAVKKRGKSGVALLSLDEGDAA